MIYLAFQASREQTLTFMQVTTAHLAWDWPPKWVQWAATWGRSAATSMHLLPHPGPDPLRNTDLDCLAPAGPTHPTNQGPPVRPPLRLPAQPLQFQGPSHWRRILQDFSHQWGRQAASCKPIQGGVGSPLLGERALLQSGPPGPDLRAQGELDCHFEKAAWRHIQRSVFPPCCCTPCRLKMPFFKVVFTALHVTFRMHDEHGGQDIEPLLQWLPGSDEPASKVIGTPMRAELNSRS